jgi:hypothetical protein
MNRKLRFMIIGLLLLVIGVFLPWIDFSGAQQSMFFLDWWWMAFPIGVGPLVVALASTYGLVLLIGMRIYKLAPSSHLRRYLPFVRVLSRTLILTLLVSVVLVLLGMVLTAGFSPSRFMVGIGFVSTVLGLLFSFLGVAYFKVDGESNTNAKMSEA